MKIFDRQPWPFGIDFNWGENANIDIDFEKS